MIKKLVNYLKNKKILILGFGKEGYSTYKFIRKYLPSQKIFISDINTNFIEMFEDVAKDRNIEIVEQDKYLKNLEQYDILMKTPGLSFKGIDTSKFINKIKSQLELFLEFVDVFIIGITGTKGKSTTSSLIYSIIKEQCEDVHLLGNIGIPLFDEIDKLKKESIVVLELSSHQLEFVKISPNISIILNIYEDHLDHYESYEHYINAKINICRYQMENNYFIYSIDNEVLNKHIISMEEKIKSSIYEISYLGNEKQNTNSKLIKKIENTVVLEENNVMYIDSLNRKILGEHNFNNIMFAITVAKIMNLDLKKAQKTIHNFEPLPHRMEFVGKYDEVKYYNDSIATIPASTINAIETLKDVNTLIIGGKDRGIDYIEFAKFLESSNIENLVCMPDTVWLIEDMVINENMEKFIVKDMKMAVSIAKKVTKKGSICLLSPAASSYGFFKNFKERGDLFKKFVKEHIIKAGTQFLPLCIFQ